MVHFGTHDTLATVHAVFACIATLGTIPAALLIGRYCRSNPKWCRYHIILNSITTFLIVLVFGLGMGAVAAQDLGTQFNGPYSDLHHKAGLGVFTVVLTQTILGVFAHATPAGKALVEGGAKHWLRWFHIGFGLTTAIVCYWLCWEGMHVEWTQMSVSMTVTPQSVQLLFWVFFLFEVAAYTLSVGNDFLRYLEAWRVGFAPYYKPLPAEKEDDAAMTVVVGA